MGHKEHEADVGVSHKQTQYGFGGPIREWGQRGSKRVAVRPLGLDYRRETSGMGCTKRQVWCFGGREGSYGIRGGE